MKKSVIRHYIIDGNNLIGKDRDLFSLQLTSPQSSRERLCCVLGGYFAGKSFLVSLHFDGYAQEAIRVPGLRIEYSDSQTADEHIKAQIARADKPSNICLVTSDFNLADFARKCTSSVVPSEEFLRMIKTGTKSSLEESLIKGISEYDILREFGLK